MKRSAAFVSLVLAAGAAQAADGLSLGLGVDYNSGDYGSETTTEILSVPVGAKYTTGDWIFRASLPWMRVDGDANVVPGLGPVDNNNPKGRGRGNGNGGGGGGEPTAPTTGVTSGIGDLRLGATYAIPMQGAWGVDLTGNVKIATADEDKGLGTGANDYGVAVDVYPQRRRGDDGVRRRRVHHARRFGFHRGRLGVQRQRRLQPQVRQQQCRRWCTTTASRPRTTADDRSEITGFFSFPTSDTGKLQLYALTGLTDGSPEWGAGVSFTTGF